MTDLNALTYQNIHSHSFYSNISTHDSVISRTDVAERAVELGHTTLSCIEHGYMGNVFETYRIAKQFNLKLIFGTEFYYVKDRFEKDRTNSHLLVVAKNENGKEAITGLISESYQTGFYGRNRIDEELLFSLPKDDVIVTTACIASPINLYEGYAEYFIPKAKAYFGKNFFLEVQPHWNKKQADFNEKLVEYRKEYNVPFILGVDTHYIKEEDYKMRDIYLKSRKIVYDKEEGFFMDYPETKTIIERFNKQAVLSDQQIIEAFNNSHIVDEFDAIIITDDIKMPSIYPDKTEKEKVKILKEHINKAWIEDRKHIPKERWGEYLNAIKYEMTIVENTHMTDYFLMNEKIIRLGKEKYGGVLTKTGRGCFKDSALVQTKDGLKKISEVSIGDKVINRFGNWDTIINTFEYDIDEEMIQIDHVNSAGKHNPIIATLDHKILIKDGDGTKFIHAKDLTKDDYVVLPKLNHKVSETYYNKIIDLNDFNDFGYRYDDEFIYEEYKGGNSRYNKKINRYIPNDKIHNIFVGLLYGDGNTRDTKISLYVNTKSHKIDINKNIFSKISDRLGLPLHVYSSKNKTMECLTFSSKVFSNFVKKEYFTSKLNKEKQFNNLLFNQSLENLSGIKEGLTLSDGSVSDGRISFDNTSKSLINSYKLLNDILQETPVSMNTRLPHVDKRGYKSKISYKMRKKDPLTSKQKLKVLEDEKNYYMPITKLTLIPRHKTKVYDLQVKDDPSFVIYNMVVHNSAPSFYLNKLLDFTAVDRVNSPLKLYPTRFMSESRILEAKSLPDVDFNTANPEPFMRAQKEILGEDNAYQMIAYGTMQEKDAFKTYCRGLDIPKNEYWTIAEDLERWAKTDKWRDIIKASQQFIGVVTSFSPHPCSSLLLSDPISKKIGVIKTKEGVDVALIGSYDSDVYKYLKNDLLVVTVWDIIAKVCKELKIEIPDVRTLSNLVANDDKVWDLYKDGMVATLNQAGTPSGKPQVMQYKPQSVRELSMWVAGIRPSFASMKSYFLNRQPFSYNIPAFDKLLKDSDNFVLFQESIMATLQFAGYEEDVTYGLLKAIAKKKKGIIEPIHDKFIEGFVAKTGSEEQALKVWTIIENAVGYSFNSSHAYSVALDSLYGAWLKATYPLVYFAVVLNVYKNSKDKQAELINELEYFDISLKGLQFGKSKSDYSYEKETNTIYKGISTVAYLNQQVADNLYNLAKERHYEKDDVVQLFLDILDGALADNRQMNILIKLGFFKEFGEESILLELYNTMTGYQTKKPNPIFTDNKKLDVKYSRTHKEKTKLIRIENIKEYYGLILKNAHLLPTTNLFDRLTSEVEYMGYAETLDQSLGKNVYVVMDVNTKYTPVYTLYNMYDGHISIAKIDKKKAYRDTKSTKDGELIIKLGDQIEVQEFTQRPKMALVDGKWESNYDQMQDYIEHVRMIERYED